MQDKATQIKVNATSNTHSGTTYRKGLMLYCMLLFVATLPLIYMGAFTTTIKAGMVFLDWPLSNGSINPEGWLQDDAMLAEHSHRLFGALVGLLSIGLAILLHIKEPRRWVRTLGWVCLILVIVQGGLGGARVLLDSLAFAAVHGCVAQVFLCLVATIALTQSTLWWRMVETPASEELPAINKLRPAINYRKLYGLGMGASFAVLLQLIVAAAMRHNDAGMAIPTFPHVPGGGFIPSYWNTDIVLAFTHRALAFLILGHFCSWIWRILNTVKDNTLKFWAMGLFFLIVVQIALGISILWTGRNEVVTTLHVLNGALFLAGTWALTFLFGRLRKAELLSNTAEVSNASPQAA